MKLDSIKTLGKSVMDALKTNSTTILTGMAVAGVISAVVMAVKATPKAIKLMEDDESDRAEKLINPGEIKSTPIDYIRVCWKVYLPSALMTGLSITCIVGAQAINLKRNAALMALYSTASTSLKEYKDKTIEMLGEKKEQAIHDAIDKDHIDENPVSSREIIETDYGEYLVYDTMSGRYFKHSIEGVRKVVNDLNAVIINNGYVTLNEFYYSLGLKNIKFGDEMGWNTSHPIDVRFSTQQADNGKPCLVLDYTTGPMYGFEPF